MIDNVDIIGILHEISLEVRNFTKHRSGNKWSFSCDVCGDSKLDKRKARFGVARKDGSYVCHCFNCGYSNSFVSYLRDFHPRLYDRYNTEKFISNAPILYDLNPLFKKIDDEKIINIFYVNKFEDIKQWANYLKQKKINLSKENITHLAKLHKNYWRKKNAGNSGLGNRPMWVV